MSLKCNIVMDLVSIYKDGLASSQTKQAVDEHLKTCRDCRLYYKQYDSVERLLSGKKLKTAPEPQTDSAEPTEKKFNDISFALQRRRMIFTACSLTIGLIAFAGIVYSTIKFIKD